MSKDPAVLFYTSDFLTGTLTMKDDEVGKYIKLLCLQHQKGRLTPIDMLFICKTYVENVYNKFQKDKDGNYYNKRMEDESIKRKKYSESRRRNISKRYEPTYVKHMEDEDENAIKDVNVIDNKINFIDFWNLYDKKTGRPNCEKKWNKLSLTDQEEVMEYIPRYKTAQPDKQYRKNPETFINQKGWKDEIIKGGQSPRGTVDFNEVAAEIEKYS